MLCGDLSGKEIQKRVCVYTHTHTHIHMADSHSWTAETDKAVQSNYTPIKKKRLKKQ